VPRFKTDPVPRALLEEIFAAAARSRADRDAEPPWSILVVEGAERERLVTSLAEALGRHWGLGALHPRGLPTEAVLGAPVLVLFFSQAPSSEGSDAVAQVMAVLQNVVLLAHAHGLGTHRSFVPSLVPETALEFAAEHLGVAVRGGDPVALLAMGWPQGTAEASTGGAGVTFVAQAPAGRVVPPGGELSADRPGATWNASTQEGPAAGESLQPPARVLRSQRGERVYVIDPYPYNRDLLMRRLTTAGYHVECFSDGESLLGRDARAAQGGGRGEPDLYIVSDSLPDMSGFDFVRRLRAGSSGAAGEAPLIVTTARRDSVFRVGGLTAGVDYYLRKPIHLIELYTAVRLLLDRHHLVEEIQRATSFQEALLAAMDNVGVLAMNQELQIVYMNPGGERLLGYTAADLIGRQPSILSPDGEPRVLTPPGAGRPLRDDIVVRRKDGSVFDAELLRFAMRDRKGAMTGYLGVFVDISVRKGMERELENANADQRRANQELTRLLDELTATQARLVQHAKMASLGQLVAGVAHEINTPLGAVVSNNDLFERCFARLTTAVSTGADLCAPEVHRDLDAIHSLLDVTRTACTRITGIVRELRTFARLDEAERKAVDLHEGLESTLLLVAHLVKGRITIVRDYQTLPRVDCHPNQINQVFMNLLVNACQAIPGEGTITIRTRATDTHVSVSIIDTGPGIAPSKLDRIFDPGYTTKGPGAGTGLGLSICYQIATAHSGEIQVDSTPTHGATFTLTLPLTPQVRG
jgi:PAS domain S-box-containing protein